MVVVTPQDAYQSLLTRSLERAMLASCSALLSWDEQTYLPRGGASYRGDQMALLAGLHHERATDPGLGDLLSLVNGSDLVADSDSPAAANVRQWLRSFDRVRRLSRPLVEELARVTTVAQGVWVEARRANDFDAFRPSLETIIRLKREEGACLADPGADPYDALLDEYEPGARTTDLAALFQALRDDLVPLVAAIAGSTRPQLPTFPGSFPVDHQRIFGETVAGALGFDFERGRLDTTAHPFCSGIGPGDCRITTRFDPNDFADGFFSILHEVGHGLYEQGFDPDHAGTPMGEAISLGVHESQSRLWENGVGRSKAFWEYWLPFARRIFREPFHAADIDSLPRRCQPGRTLLDPRAGRRGYLQPPYLDPVRVGASPDRGRPDCRRPAHRLERPLSVVPRDQSPRRRARLPARHPLGCRPDRLLSHLYARQHLRRATPRQS